MKTMSMGFAAGQSIELNLDSVFFYLLATVAPIDLDFQSAGGVTDSARAVEFGFWTKPKGGFNKLILTSATAQTIKFAIGLGDSGYNRNSGAVQIIGQQGAITEGQVQLTNVNQTIIAARVAGMYTLIQNNDPVAIMRVTLDGVAASATRGFRLQPGQPLDLSSFNPSGAINACMETATATAANCEFAFA